MSCDRGFLPRPMGLAGVAPSTMVELKLFNEWTQCTACGGLTGSSCSSSNSKLMLCANCNCVAYHNVKCQRAHWKLHKCDCKELTQAMLPLKQLVRWWSNRNSKGSCFGCWWEPGSGFGISAATLIFSNDKWEEGYLKWNNKDYLIAMEGFQKSLEPYSIAWSCSDKSCCTNDTGENDLNSILFVNRSITLAKRFLFCAYCEMDGNQIESARQRLVRCISICMTILFCTNQSLTSFECNIRRILNDAWMELMLSMEEVQQHRIIARHVAALAIATGCCGWSDPWQRPGFMHAGLSSIPHVSQENHPSWCRELENNWWGVLNDYNQLNSTPSNFSNVGSGQRGSGHDDHMVVSGVSWKEYVLFGTGSKESDNDASFTKQLLRKYLPDAVELAERGGGEVIFSCLSPRTFIKSHCGPTNLRWTVHLGLVNPNSSGPDCQIRVRENWYSWQPGHILLFDDSFEHEVRNDTDETRVVLLIRIWHPQLACMERNERESILAKAIAKKEEEVAKRYHPPM